MDQFLSRLLDKYGLIKIAISFVVGFAFLWGLAHFTAAPGGNVSVLWGLVQYTKSKPNASIIAPGIANSESTTNPQASDHNQDTTKLPPTVLPVLSNNIGVINGITEKTLDQTLQSLRRQSNLRELDALESGKIVAETPRGSYFFITCYSLNVSSENMAVKLTNANVSRYRSNDSYFEFHYPQNGNPIIIGFASESDAARLTSPTHEIRNISVAALPWTKMSSLVSIPVNQIITSKRRDLDISKETQITILDVEIK